MYFFVKKSKEFLEIQDFLIKKGDNSIIIEEIVLTNKEESKKKLEEYKEFIKKNNIENTSILINLGKIESWKVGFINSLKNDFNILIGVGGLNKNNRFFLEKTKIDLLLNPQSTKEKQKIDFIHHLNMGMNQVLFTIAKEKSKNLCIFTNEIPKNIFQFSKEIARIRKIAQLSNKYGIKIHIQNLIYDKYDYRSKILIEKLMLIFGLSTKNISSSKNLVEELIKKEKLRKSGKLIQDGLIRLDK